MLKEVLEKIETELDEDFFIYSGFLCHIKRSDFNSLCGYVYLDKNYPWYGQIYDDIEASVHGGLTFSVIIEDHWVIGFDCAHANDFVPKMVELTGMEVNEEVYRDWAYVKNEVESLAYQAAMVCPGKVDDRLLAKKLLEMKND